MSIPIEIARELLDYDPETGVFTWRHREAKWCKTKAAHASCVTRFEGKRAGTLSVDPKNGYQHRIIRLLGFRDYEHRLAWRWMSNDPLPPQIDHKNRDATDNRWCNLRASDNGANGKNHSMHRNNTSGATGVTWDKCRNKWRSRCRLHRKWYHLGRFSNFEDAKRAVSEFRKENGFDPGHGLEKAAYHRHAP
tara:strand:- start:9387 stop:9962 length:576 start_codon:yes stop_codon:yes gene_type:complete